MDSPTLSSPSAFGPQPPVWRSILLDRLTCALVAMLALAGYLATMPPGVTGEDSGELIAAAWVLGIPHPPGYPLWCLLACPILHLVDFGAVAWRGNLASALIGAAGVWLVAETVLSAFGRRWAAVVAGLALAFSKEYWQQAIIAEIYTLSAALVAAHLLCVVRWTRSRSQPTLYAAGLFAGLATAHYSLNAVLLPMLFVLYFVQDLRPRRWRRYGWLGLVSMAGAMVYLYLPIRSAANPAMDWGNPQTWTGFWDVVLRRQYLDLFDVRSGVWSWSAAQRSFSEVTIQLSNEFTILILVLIIVRVYQWIKTVILNKTLNTKLSHEPHSTSAVSVYFACAFVALLAATGLVPQYPHEYQWDWLRSAYVLPLSVVMAIAVGAFVAYWSEGWRWVYWLMGLMAIVLPLFVNAGANNRKNDRIAEVYGRDVLSGMAPDAVYFGGGDHTVFPAVYLNIVEGVRPDVLLADRYGYPVPDTFALAGESVPAQRPSDADEQRLLERILSTTTRPVYSAVPKNVTGGARVNEGLVYRYLRDGEERAPMVAVEMPPEAYDTRGEWSNELIAHEYLAARGRSLFDLGRPVEALAALDEAADFIHEDKHALNNLGLNAAEGGQVEAGAVYFGRALESDPLFLPAALNLAKCFLMQGTPDKALAIVQRFEDAGIVDPALDEMKRAAQDVREDANAAR